MIPAQVLNNGIPGSVNGKFVVTVGVPETRISALLIKGEA